MKFAVYELTQCWVEYAYEVDAETTDEAIQKVKDNDGGDDVRTEGHMVKAFVDGEMEEREYDAVPLV